MKNAIKIMMILVLFIILFSNLAFSLGITPANKALEYEPGKHDIEFEIYNNEKKDFNAVVNLRGKLSQYCDEEELLVKLEGEQKTIPFDIELDLPKDLEPGKHYLEVKVSEFSEEEEEGKTMVSTVPSVEAKLEVRVPYPEKHMEAKLKINQKEDKVRFNIPLFNFGSERIKGVNAKIKILGPTNEVIEELKTESTSLDPQSQQTLLAKSKEELNPGVYHAVSTIEYDGEILRLEKNFDYGKKEVNIKQIKTGDYSLGQIASFDIQLESQWNKKLENVYGEVKVYDDEKDKVDSFKTSPIEISPRGEGTINAYWDTEGLKAGDYNMEVEVNYEDSKNSRDVKVNLGANSIETDFVTGKSISNTNKGENFSYDSIILSLILILIFVNIILIYIVVKKLKSK